MFNFFFFSKIMQFMSLCMKSIVEADRPQMNIWYMHIASWAVYELMHEKYCRGGQATDEHMVHAHCKLDT